MRGDKDTGGPAFPSTNEIQLGEWKTNGHAGISIRDYFAAKAMQSLVSKDASDSIPDEELSAWAYQMADAMLKERNK